MWTRPDDELARITDYLAGELTPQEMAAAEHWIDEDSDRRALVAELRRSRAALRHTRAAVTDVEAIVRSVTSRAVAMPAGRTPGRVVIGNWSRLRAWGAVASAAVIVGIAGLSFMQRSSHGSSTAFTYHTGATERQRVVFPDGSVAVMAPESDLEVAAGFGDASNRTVTLRGQALFTVTHAAGAPFVVRTGSVSTRVLGTSFAVRRYAQDTATQLVVAQGRIAVGTAVFGTGDIATVTNDKRIVVSRGNAVAEQLAWAEGRLVFSGTQLRDAIPMLERWYGITVTVDDPALLDRRVTTTLGPESTMRAMELIAFTVEGRATLRDRHAVIHSR